MRSTLSSLTLVLAVAAATPAAQAGTVTFDFENETPTFISGDPRTGALNSVMLSDSGLMMTITRPGGAFDLVQNSGGAGLQDGKPGSWGNVSLDPFFDSNGNMGADASPFIVNFSQAVSNVMVEYGDYDDDDDDDVISLEAFSMADAAGALVDSDTGDVLPNGVGTATDFSSGGPLSVSGSIRSLRLVGGSEPPPANDDFPHSLFWDNFNVTFDMDNGGPRGAPEPSSCLMAGTALLGLLLVRRRGARRA